MDDRSVAVAIVTGGSSAIGKELIKSLAGSGVYGLIILANRDESKTLAEIEEIRQGAPLCKLEFSYLDLESFDSVKRFTYEFRSRKLPLQLLVNNAGCSWMNLPQEKLARTEDGYDVVFQVNFLSHFLLTQLLIDILLASGGSRVINLTSVAHRLGSTDFARTALSGRNLFSYRTAQLASVIYSYELNRRYFLKGLLAIAVNPGTVDSEFWHKPLEEAPKPQPAATSSVTSREALRQQLARTGWTILRPILAGYNKCAAVSPARAAATVFWCATKLKGPTSHDIREARQHISNKHADEMLQIYIQPYFCLCNVTMPFELGFPFSFYQGPQRVKSSLASRSLEIGRKLWNIACSLTAWHERMAEELAQEVTCAAADRITTESIQEAIASVAQTAASKLGQASGEEKLHELKVLPTTERDDQDMEQEWQKLNRGDTSALGVTAGSSTEGFGWASAADVTRAEGPIGETGWNAFPPPTEAATTDTTTTAAAAAAAAAAPPPPVSFPEKPLSLNEAIPMVTEKVFTELRQRKEGQIAPEQVSEINPWTGGQTYMGTI